MNKARTLWIISLIGTSRLGGEIWRQEYLEVGYPPSTLVIQDPGLIGEKIRNHIFDECTKSPSFYYDTVVMYSD